MKELEFEPRESDVRVCSTLLDCEVSLRITLLQGRQNSLTLMPSFLIPGVTRPGNGGVRSPREENGNPLQYPCLGNHMDRGFWWDTAHGIAEESERTR